MRRHVEAGSAAALLLLTGASFYYERYQAVVACLALLAFVVLLRASAWLGGRRALSLALGVDILLVFVYLWSLDERVHIVIRGASTYYAADIGKKTVTLGLPARWGGIGLKAGSDASYRIGAAGDAHLGGDPSPLARFFQLVRFAAPRPAWTNIRLSLSGGAARAVGSLPRRDDPSGSWSVNPRGELEGSLGSTTYFNARAGGRFTLQADLMRPDGQQGVLVGLDPDGTGRLFQVQLRSTQGQWYLWKGGRSAGVGPSVSAWFDGIAQLQHNLRLVLANVLTGALLLLLAIASYEAVSWVTPHAPRRRRSLALPPLPARAADAGAAVMALGACVSSALIADRLLQRIPHIIDSVAYYFQAENFASGRLWRSVPAHQAFFGIGYTVMHAGKWFGKYPPGWPLVLAAGVALGGAWLVNPILTGVNVFVMYLTGREAYGRGIGLLAAVLALSSPFLLALGAEYMSHTAELTFLLVATLLFLRWRNRLSPSPRRGARAWPLLLPAGFCLGTAFITRNLDPIAYALPFVALLPFRSPRRCLEVVLWLAAGAAVPLAFDVIYNWQLTGSPLTSPFLLYDPNDHPGFGVPKGPAGNFTPEEALSKTVSHLESLLGHLFGWPYYLTLAVAAIPFLLGRVKRMDVVFGLSALAVVLAYMTYFDVGPSFDPRYWAPTAPSLIFLTARGFQELYGLGTWLPSALPRSKIAALAFPILLGLFLLAGDAFVYLPAQLPVYRGYYGVSAELTRPLDGLRLRNALVFVGNGSPNAPAPPDVDPYLAWLALLRNSPDLTGDVIFAQNLGARDIVLIRQYPHRQYYIFNGKTLIRLVVR